MTVEERHERRNLLELMIQIGENYHATNRTDQELFTVLALDAKRLPNRRLTPADAAALLADPAQGATGKLAAMDASWAKH
ncbi:hypothetical protein [Paraburkholderia sp. UCT2]|uniref:hypothetical protein n=1 Tax=Paraburkholderia sp. UCT2 TaxID=2615208 RepID=UPI0016552440|nr:hypothetical protein [Paraburkholderia sp. UCT2]MBC8731717.1 hypothetical protein [Paraburkholderia sp. UCT2]